MLNTSTTQARNFGPEPAPSFSRTFGLRVRVAVDSTQQFLFGGDGPSVLTQLAERLCVEVTRMVVCDFRIHSQLERTVPAILRNVRQSFWSCAKRAALDAASALASGAKRRVIQPDLAIRAANVALRIAEICSERESKVRAEKRIEASYEAARHSEVGRVVRARREREARRLAEASLSDEDVALIEREMGGRR